MDAADAFIGPLLAITLIALLSDDIGLVLWFALIPAVLLFGVKEPDVILAAKGKDGKRSVPLHRDELAQMNGSQWLVVTIGMLFALARFSIAFLALSAVDLDLPIGLSPFVLVLMSVVFSLSSYPAGMLVDCMDRSIFLALGFAARIVAELLLANALGYFVVLIAVAFWGIHLGLTQGLLSAFVADSALGHLRGTAFGIYNLTNGVSLLFASIVAGVLWQTWGASITFYADAVFAGMGLLLILISFRSHRA
jgi:MFS family permease